MILQWLWPKHREYHSFGICPDRPRSMGGKSWVPMRCSPLCEGSPAPRTGSPGSKPAWENSLLFIDCFKWHGHEKTWSLYLCTVCTQKIPYRTPEPCYFHSENHLRNAFCPFRWLPGDPETKKQWRFRKLVEIGVATRTFVPAAREGWHKVPKCRRLQGTLSRSAHLDLEVNRLLDAAEVVDNDQRKNLVVDHQEFSSIPCGNGRTASINTPCSENWTRKLPGY